MPAKGGAATQITRGLAWDRRPVWSPDGNLLAYISDGTGSDNVWVVEADGTNPRSVSDEDELGLEGAEWQSNGHRIVVARRSNVLSTLPLVGVIYDVDGRKAHELYELEAQHGISVKGRSIDGEFC